MTSSIQAGYEAYALQSPQIDNSAGNAAKKAPDVQSLATPPTETSNQTKAIQSDSPSTIVTLSDGVKEADLTYEAAVVGSSGGVRKPPP